MDTALQNKKRGPVLIVDKEGNIGESLLEGFKNTFEKIIYVSSKKPRHFSNLQHLLFTKKISGIPKDNYSKIIIVFNDKEIFEFLPQFIKESEESKGDLFFIMPFEYAEKVLKLEQNPKNFHTLILGEIFGRVYFKNEISNLLIQAKKQGVVSVSGFGMQKKHPVYYDDVITVLTQIILKEKHVLKRFYLFSKNPVTNLSFLRLLQKVNPELKINFIEEKDDLKDYIFPEGEHLFENKFIENRIHDYFNNLKIGDREYEGLKKEIDNKKNIKNKKHNRANFLYIFSFLAIFILIPFVSFLILSLVSFYQLSQVKKAIDRGDFINAKKSASMASDLLEKASAVDKILVFEASLAGQEENALKAFKNIDSAKEAADLVVDLTLAFENFIKISAGKSDKPKEEFIQTTNLLKQSLISFQRIKTEDKNIFLKSIVSDQKRDKTIQLLSSLSGVMPDLLGFEGEKKYLVLFQNNMELRPGGGFIGSFAILSLEYGRIKDFKVYDVYDADGQLKGHIEPPFVIRRYFPLVHWYFRDSNFDVDFAKNASNAVYFLNQEMGVAVDGVIGADISFLKNLLSAVGPVNVSDYNETVNADNLYIVTQSHVEKDFFKGSTQKKDFLKSLYSSIMNKLSSNNLPYLKIAEAVVASVNQKHFLLVSGDTDIQRIFTVNGLSSSLWDNRKNEKGIINDFFGISEANIGSNKANYFIKRKIEQQVFIDEAGRITEKATIYYKNEGSKWPGGDYKNYIRFILPSGSKLRTVAIDGIEQKLVGAVTDFKEYEAKDFKPPQGLEVEESQQNGKSIFGFLVIIPQSFAKKISVTYEVPQNKFMELPYFSYSLKVFKQPGTEDDPYSFSLQYPQNLKIYSSSEGLSADRNPASLSTNLSEDRLVEVSFSRK